jgi:hypothetical protein
VQTFETNLDGKLGPTVFEMTETSVTARSSNGERSAALGDVVAVKLNELDGTGICELVLRSGTSFHISSGDKQHGAAAGYNAFVRALHERLAAAGRGVRFERGSWLLVGVYVAIVAVVCAGAALVHFDVITPPAGFVIRGKVLIGLAVACVVAAPFLIARARPQPYDPHAIPGRMLPGD